MMERDEYGIPKGEHKAVCGCEFHGRSLLKTCDEHKNAFSLDNNFSVEMEMPNPSVVHLLKNFKTKPFYWQEYFNKLDIPSVQNLKEEFEELRKQGPKWSLTQYARMHHIEEHLDKGEIVCRCYQGENE